MFLHTTTRQTEYNIIIYYLYTYGIVFGKHNYLYNLFLEPRILYVIPLRILNICYRISELSVFNIQFHFGLPLRLYYIIRIITYMYKTCAENVREFMFIFRNPSNFTNKKEMTRFSRTLEQWFKNKIIIIKTEKNY